MKKSYSLLNEVTLILVLLKFDMDAVSIEIEIWVKKLILSIYRAFLIVDDLGISFSTNLAFLLKTLIWVNISWVSMNIEF